MLCGVLTYFGIPARVLTVASNAHKIIFGSHLPQPLKPRNMKMKIGG